MESRTATDIKYYTPAHWVPMWQLRHAQLAEHGISVSDEAIPTTPGLPENDTYEWDMNHIDEVYLSGGGGFWLAWQEDEPIGCVGAQDIGGLIELRRMYVKAANRRQGIGTLLVQALVDHCRSAGTVAVELWTPEDGEGRWLYETIGFEQVGSPLLGFEAVEQATRREPNPEEIRMRLGLLLT